MSGTNFFDTLIWQKDRMLLGDLVFRLEHYKNDETWELGESCFVFFKIKPLVEQYARFWNSYPTFNARNILELGIWEGGGLVFWFEYFHPQKHVGIDLLQKKMSPYFQTYIQSQGIENKIRTYWGINQTDAETLRQIISAEFNEPLDLVIDDASHMYKETKLSFEILFPFLRPGGLYIVEDWAWEHWKDFQSPGHPWAAEKSLTPLIFELVEATGSSQQLIASLNVCEGFTVVERGPIDIAEPWEFKLDSYISKRPTLQQTKQRFRKFIRDHGSIKHTLQTLKHYLQQKF